VYLVGLSQLVAAVHDPWSLAAFFLLLICLFLSRGR
jgi:hypothetical protein